MLGQDRNEKSQADANGGQHCEKGEDGEERFQIRASAPRG
jgi:hypothetical protein